jgi:hypothetical protein
MGTTMARTLGDMVLRDNERTPFPNVYDGGKYLNAEELTGLPPNTWDTLSNRGKIGRSLETIGTTGLNQLFRTGTKGVESVDYPTYGYSNMALGPNMQDPAAIPYSQTASDIKNAMNYKYRLGLKTTLLGVAPLYLGYKAYDAYANPCQCKDPDCSS